MARIAMLAGPRGSGSGDRARGGRLARIDAEGEDSSGLDADDGVLEPLAEGLASGRDHGGGPADLDHAGLPRREHVVDHDAGPPRPLHVAELLGLAHPQAAYVDGVVLGVVAE